MSLNGKVALVTGAAQGLGKGFAEILLKNEAKVALVDIDEDVGQDTKSTFDKEYGPERTVFLKCDVTSEEQFKDAFKKAMENFNKINIVCNNAGIVNEKHWEKTVSINLCGVVRGTYLALEHMKKENGGQGGVIVNVASLAGLGPLPLAPIYTGTKHGVVGFSRALAEVSKLCNYGVRINVLCPSFTQTAVLTDITSEDKAGQFSNLKELAQQIMETFGVLQVCEVAEQFLQLVVDESRDGEVLVVAKEMTGYVTFPKDIRGIIGPPSASAL